MQRDHQPYTKTAVPSFVNQVGNDYMNHIPGASAFGAALPPVAKPSMPFNGIEFQPTQVCPKNFIVFDQTNHRSQILYHPAMAHKFNSHNVNTFATYIQGNFERKDDVVDVEKDLSTSLKEDSDDINALLSLEEEEEEEYDDEEVSTARTNNYGSLSDSGSSYSSKSQGDNISSSTMNSRNCRSERKRQRVKEMVQMLRGIVPGGDEMNTVAVLDEAVKYLKSLKVEVQKLEVGNSQT